MLEVTAAEHVARHVEAMTGRDLDGLPPLLSIEDDPDDPDPDPWPAQWQRAVAFRVRQQLPHVLITDARGGG